MRQSALAKTLTNHNRTVQTFNPLGDGSITEERIHIYGSNPIEQGAGIEFEVQEDPIESSFGDHNGCIGFITRTGRLIRWIMKEQPVKKPDIATNIARCCVHSTRGLQKLSSGEAGEQGYEGTSTKVNGEPKYFDITSAGNGTVTAILKPAKGSTALSILQFRSIGNGLPLGLDRNLGYSHPPGSLLAWHFNRTNGANEPISEKVLDLTTIDTRPMLVANAVAYCLLVQSQEVTDVYTWGDERYPPVLGREVSDDAPATTPQPVSLLKGPFKIKKVVAGGFMMAAISDLGEGWIWGLGATPGFDGLGNRADVRWFEHISESEGSGDFWRKIGV